MSEEFNPETHIRNILTQPTVNLYHPDGHPLQGICGVAGVAEFLRSGARVGADRLLLAPGAEFELHTHPGAHILYVLRSRGIIHVDGVDYDMAAGDTVFVPAEYAHAVKTNPAITESLELLAFGVPHMPLESKSRMTIVQQ